MNKFLKIGILTALGAAAGYAYFHFWGCTNGCPMQSNWLIMTSYGAAVGLVLGLPGRKEKKDDDQSEDK